MVIEILCSCGKKQVVSSGRAGGRAKCPDCERFVPIPFDAANEPTVLMSAAPASDARAPKNRPRFLRFARSYATVEVRRVVAGLMLVEWFVTIGVPSPFNTLSLGSAALLLSLEVSERVAALIRHRSIFGVACCAAVLCVWSYFDVIVEKTVSIGYEFTERRMRYGRAFHQTVTAAENAPHSWIIDGPLAGDPPMRHGHWVWAYPMRPEHIRYEHEWYWYGERIAQGEWQLRSK